MLTLCLRCGAQHTSNADECNEKLLHTFEYTPAQVREFCGLVLMVLVAQVVRAMRTQLLRLAATPHP